MGQKGRNVYDISVAALKAAAYKVESKGNNNHQDDNDNVGGQATEIKLIQEGKVMEDCFQNIHGCDNGSIIAKQSEFSNHKTSNELVTKGSYFVSMASSALLLLINEGLVESFSLKHWHLSLYLDCVVCGCVCVTMCFDNSIHNNVLFFTKCM
jgi:hypothetical protein